MGFALKTGEANMIPKGTVLFDEKEPVNCVVAVLKGSLVAVGDYVKITLPAGSFVGFADIAGGRSLLRYEAPENCAVYPFPIESPGDIRGMLAANNKEYKGMIVSSLAHIYADLVNTRNEYQKLSAGIYKTLTDGYSKYINACKTGGMAVAEIEGFDSLEAYSEEEPFQENRSFIEMSAIPVPVMKAYYAESMEMTADTIDRLCENTVKILEYNAQIGEYVSDYCGHIYNDGEKNLLCNIVKLSRSLDAAGRSDKALEGLAKSLAEFFVGAENMSLGFMGSGRPVNRERLEKLTGAIGTGAALELDSGNDEPVNVEDFIRSLKNSMKTILTFGGVSGDTAAKFEEAVTKFVDAKDRMSTEDEGRNIRRAVVEPFYKVYESVFFKSLETHKLPPAVQLFLHYGYVDERLLTRDELAELAKLDFNSNRKYFCNIYTLPEWLRAIYEGQREPSKNEFDLEYMDALREMIKTREITEAQAKELAKDQKAKVNFEITKVFKYIHRVVNGSLGTFTPVLCSEQLSGPLMKALITKDRMGQVVERYRELDFMTFYREQLYANKDLNIEKETVQVEVAPDIILFPCFGSNAQMWQDISCKHRDAPGRFFFPLLVEGHLEDLYIRTIGRFRWELCRTMHGLAWNDITEKSLTSEYSDYIQYYKKNRDLTDDKKEKIKNQIAKAKNSVREVFVQDYEQWIKAESAGGIKLNKVARDIVALYCPFNKEVRKSLESQPAFQESLARHAREAAKKTKELDLRYKSLGKNGKEIPEIMLNTLSLYKDR